MKLMPLGFRPKTSLFFVLVFASLSTCAVAQTRIPQFKDFTATETYTGKTAPLILTRDDRMFRTRLSEAAKGKPNFAGHYILTTWGCGTSCLAGAVIDAKTGRVYWLPHTICCWGYDVDDKFEPVEARPNSSLIVFSGARNEKEGDNGAHFYKFENNRFVHIYSKMKAGQ
jgi:hypothetical protein